MTWRLVLDPAEPCQLKLAELIAAGCPDAATPQRIPLGAWDQSPGRWPGDAGDWAITLLLAAPPAGVLPPGTLLLAEWSDGAAQPFAAACGVAPLLTRAACSGFAVLAADPQSGERQLRVLLQATVPTLPGLRRQQRRLVTAAAETLLWWLALCEQRQQLLLIQPCRGVRLRSAGRLRRRHRLQATGLRLVSSLQRRLGQSLGRVDSDWQIVIGRLDASGRSLMLEHRLPPGPAGWFADPQLVADADRLWLFCERLDPVSGLGVIDLFALEADGLKPHGTVLQEPFHLSFPRVFRHQGRWFATVESAANREVRLYEADRFPRSWRLRRVLLSGDAWIDPILLPTPQGWALLVSNTPLASLPRETAPALHLFVAADLLSEPFLPHPESPLLFDSAAGRNGGRLELQGQRWRVAQQVGYGGSYGQNLSLRHIEVLDASHYREQPSSLPWLWDLAQRLRASHLHTLNSCGDWIAIDYRQRGGR